MWSETTRRLSRAWRRASASSWTSAGSTNHPPSSDRSASSAERSRRSAVGSAGAASGDLRSVGSRQRPRRAGASGRRPAAAGAQPRVQIERLRHEPAGAGGITVHPGELLVLAQRAELPLEALARDRAARHLEDARLVVEDQRAQRQAAAEPALEEDPDGARAAAVDAGQPGAHRALRRPSDHGPRGRRGGRHRDACLLQTVDARAWRPCGAPWSAPGRRARASSGARIGAVAPHQLAQRPVERGRRARAEVGRRPRARARARARRGRRPRRHAAAGVVIRPRRRGGRDRRARRPVAQASGPEVHLARVGERASVLLEAVGEAAEQRSFGPAAGGRSRTRSGRRGGPRARSSSTTARRSTWSRKIPVMNSV